MESGPAFLRRMVKSFYRAIVYTGGGREHDQILVRADDRVDCPQSEFFGKSARPFRCQPISARGSDPQLLAYRTKLMSGFPEKKTIGHLSRPQAKQ